jgi:CBS domain-containing protein
MNVRDVMTTEVWSVTPDTPLKEVAAMLVTASVSGVPVCDSDRHVLGVVSERDIIVKEQLRPEAPGRLTRLLLPDDEDKVKAEAHTAGEAMTSPALTTKRRAASATCRCGPIELEIKRLPVVDEDGRLVGIVTRTDLVRLFARRDDVVAAEIRDEVLRGALWLQPEDVHVHVQAGEVRLDGEVESESDAEVLPRLVARVPGVVAVDSRLRVRPGVAG